MHRNYKELLEKYKNYKDNYMEELLWIQNKITH